MSEQSPSGISWKKRVEDSFFKDNVRPFSPRDIAAVQQLAMPDCLARTTKGFQFMEMRIWTTDTTGLLPLSLLFSASEHYFL